MRTSTACRLLSQIPACLWLLALVGPPIIAQPTWPQFRGPRGDGVADGLDLPVEFGPETNVLWKTLLPPGHSSPVIWKDRIFLTGTGSGETASQLETLCLDRLTGEILWRRPAPADRIFAGHRTNSPASPTPVVDGERVYIYFGSFGLLAYDLDGNEVWRRALRRPMIPWGVGCSPVLAGDTLLLNQDQDVGAHLLAVDKRTGETKWQADRSEFRRGFSTPLVAPDLGEVILAGSTRIAGYELETGREVWTVGGLPYQVSPSPVVSGSTIYFAGWDALGGGTMKPFTGLVQRFDADGDGNLSKQEYARHSTGQFDKYDRDKDNVVTMEEYEDFGEFFRQAENKLLAIKTGGSGDVTGTHVLWTGEEALPHVPSVLVYRGRVHVVTHGGRTACYDAGTGELLYRARLPAQGGYFASPVASDGRIYFSSADGVVSVIESAPTMKVLARNDLGEAIMASPAAADGTLYLRTTDHLYAFGT